MIETKKVQGNHSKIENTKQDLIIQDYYFSIINCFILDRSRIEHGIFNQWIKHEGKKNKEIVSNHR